MLFPDPDLTPIQAIGFGMKETFLSFSHTFSLTRAFHTMKESIMGRPIEHPIAFKVGDRRLTVVDQPPAIALDYQNDLAHRLLSEETLGVPQYYLRKRTKGGGSVNVKFEVYSPVSFLGQSFRNSTKRNEFILVVVFVISIGVSIGTGALLGFHMYLAMTNQTTLEVFEASLIQERYGKEAEKYIRKYDKGMIRNLSLVSDVSSCYSFV